MTYCSVVAVVVLVGFLTFLGDLATVIKTKENAV